MTYTIITATEAITLYLADNTKKILRINWEKDDLEWIGAKTLETLATVDTKVFYVLVEGGEVVPEPEPTP